MQMLLTATLRKDPVLGRFQKLYPKLFYAVAYLHSVLVMHSQLETSVYQFRMSDFLVRKLSSKVKLDKRLNMHGAEGASLVQQPFQAHVKPEKYE